MPKLKRNASAVVRRPPKVPLQRRLRRLRRRPTFVRPSTFVVDAALCAVEERRMLQRALKESLNEIGKRATTASPIRQRRVSVGRGQKTSPTTSGNTTISAGSDRGRKTSVLVEEQLLVTPPSTSTCTSGAVGSATRSSKHYANTADFVEWMCFKDTDYVPERLKRFRPPKIETVRINTWTSDHWQ